MSSKRDIIVIAAANAVLRLASRATRNRLAQTFADGLAAQHAKGPAPKPRLHRAA